MICEHPSNAVVDIFPEVVLGQLQWCTVCGAYQRVHVGKPLGWCMPSRSDLGGQGPTGSDGQPFRALILGHDWRGAKGLCIGAEGYSKESFVVLLCSEDEKARFPVGTKFDLIRVEEEPKVKP